MTESYDGYEEFRGDPAIEAALRICRQLHEEAVDDADWSARAVDLFAGADKDDEALQVIVVGRIIEEAPMALVSAVLDDDLDGAQLAMMFLQHTDTQMDLGETGTPPLLLAIHQRCSLGMMALLVDHSSEGVAQAGSGAWAALLAHERDPWRDAVEQLLQAAAARHGRQ